MKNKTILLISFCFFLISISGYAQKAKIETNEKSIETMIQAVSNDEVFTENGNFKFSDIKEILFEVYDPKFLSLYTKLQIKVPVKFGDGTDLGFSNTSRESLGNLNTITFDINKLPVKDGLISYEKVIPQIGTKGSLQSSASRFVAEIYRSANDVIQLNDRESGIIIAKGNFEITNESKQLIGNSNVISTRKILHTLKIELKDNRYKVTLSNFEFMNDPNALIFNGKVEPIYKEAISFQENPPSKNYNFHRKVFESSVYFFEALDNYVGSFFELIEKEISKNQNEDW
jgi:hypothetical protein